MSRAVFSEPTLHRRRILLEDKAKVLASDWGTDCVTQPPSYLPPKLLLIISSVACLLANPTVRPPPPPAPPLSCVHALSVSDVVIIPLNLTT